MLVLHAVTHEVVKSCCEVAFHPASYLPVDYVIMIYFYDLDAIVE